MPSFWSDTKLRGRIFSISDLVHNELVRYIQKGSGLIGALSITLFFFFILPSLIYPIYMKFGNQDRSWMITFDSTFVYLSSLLLSNFALNVIYSAKHPYFEQFKIESEPWPWETDAAAYKLLRNSLGKCFIIDNFIIVPLLNFMSVYKGSLNVNLDPLDYPSSFEIITQFIFCLLLSDFAFYFSHRLLHSPWFYKTIHIKHHEANVTFGWIATCAHPIEFLFGNLLPSVLGMTILGNRSHIITKYLWNYMKIIDTTDVHCGYEFPWSPFRLLPMSASAKYHSFHHLHNTGNFSGFFTFWDSLFGTNQRYLNYSAKANLD